MSFPDAAGLFVIGGAQIYTLAFAHPRCRFVYLTRVHGTFDCDVFLPALELLPNIGLILVLAYIGFIATAAIF